MLQVKLPVVDTIHPQSNNFAMGVENTATGNSNSKLDDSPTCIHVPTCLIKLIIFST